MNKQIAIEIIFESKSIYINSLKPLAFGRLRNDMLENVASDTRQYQRYFSPEIDGLSWNSVKRVIRAKIDE